MVEQDVPSRGVEVKEQHRVPWPEMVLGRGDPKPRQAKRIRERLNTLERIPLHCHMPNSLS